MSRHRNVRSMNYSEEYEGFDDVYGHSVEDDHCISPSEARFLYDRSRRPQMSAFINEEDEHSTSDSESKEFDKSQLCNIDEEKLRLCVDDIQNVIGDMVPQSTIEEIVLKYDYDVQRSLNHILNENETVENTLLEEPLPQREKKVKNKDRGGGDGPGNPVRKLIIPKLNKLQLQCKFENIKLSEDNSFMTLQTLMDNHKGSAVHEDDSIKFQSNLSGGSTTLAEFSKSFLNQNASTDISSLPTDKPSFIIPKLKRKTVENCDSKWLIDLSSALKSDLDMVDESRCRDPSEIDANAPTHSHSSDDIFLESNFDASKILNVKLELTSKNSSPFGKILCRNWKCTYVNLVKRETVWPSRVVRFDFSTPSPDDLILKNLRRKWA